MAFPGGWDQQGINVFVASMLHTSQQSTAGPRGRRCVHYFHVHAACMHACRQASTWWLSTHVGAPPFPSRSLAELPRTARCVQDWLGIGQVSPVALWMLFLAFAATSLQVEPRHVVVS